MDHRWLGAGWIRVLDCPRQPFSARRLFRWESCRHYTWRQAAWGGTCVDCEAPGRSHLSRLPSTLLSSWSPLPEMDVRYSQPKRGILRSWHEHQNLWRKVGVGIRQIGLTNSRFEFDKRGQLFIRTHDETLSVVAMRVWQSRSFARWNWSLRHSPNSNRLCWDCQQFY